jgi:RND superfamily putative drug exporter
MNFTARAARWSAANWKKATFGWLAFVVVAVALGQAVGVVKLDEREQGTGEEARAHAMLAHAGLGQAAGEDVLVQSASATARQPAFRRVVDEVLTQVGRMPQVASARSPYARGAGGQISADGHSALVHLDLRGNAETASDRVQPLLDRVARVQQRASGFVVQEFGDASASRALRKATNDGLARAEKLSLPITFAILLFAFGAFVAAGIPVLLAFSAVLAAGGLSAVLSHAAHQSDATSSVMLLMGMAVGVDYSLFYLRREREERRRGLPPRAALLSAAATSGRAVLVSGVTVLIAMAGMLLTGTRVFTSLGVGAMLVVFAAVVGSLTVLPALLGRLGDKVEKGAVRRRRAKRDGSRVWDLVLDRVLRFPRSAVALSVCLLALLAMPVFGMHTTFLSAGDMPHDIAAVKTYERIQRAFPGAPQPAQVAVHARDVTALAVQAAIAAAERLALASGRVHQPLTTVVSRDRTVALVSMPLSGDGENDASKAALRTLRGRVLPATLGAQPGVSYAVGGEAAGTTDFNDTLKSHAPVVFAFVLGLAFLLLLVTFRSLVIPALSIALNLASVGAAYGVLVWVFQDGHLQGPLSFHSNGAVVTWLPLFLFSVLFGLSMDYHVFILSRIRELRDSGMATTEAVSSGIRTSAGTVTAAAAVMVAVFAIFASLPTLDIKQMGVGLAVAVLLDATLIRGVLLPAAMTLLGEWNWYLPRWLRWLPRVRLEGQRAAMGSRAQPVAEAA